MNKQTQTNKKQNKQTNKQANKNSRFRKSRITVLFYVLVLLLQHPILVLVFKQKLCCHLAKWLGGGFFFLFLLSFRGSCLVSGCGSLSLYVVLRFFNQLWSPPVVLLWSWVFTVLGYWGLASLPRPLSLGQGQWSISQPLAVCFDGLLIIFQFCCVVWLWMLLTGSGDELCGPLPTLFQAAAYHLPTVSPSAFPAFVYW
jgi:hypothetical protein